MADAQPPRIAGRYIRQPQGYRAFVPAPLPPTPDIRIDGEMQALLSRADRALGRLDGSIQTLPNPDLFVLMYIRKEAVLSSQIEGTQASLNDVLTAEAKILDPAMPGDVNEVINYTHALRYGLERLETLPLSLRLVREIHERLMRGTRGGHLTPGEFRTSQNWIGPEGAPLAAAAFVPPPPTELADSLGNLETFLHETYNAPVLVKIGLAHAQFETIHPFLDGNGRVGRLLITFLLCEQNVLSRPVLYLSHFLKNNRQRYYDLLQATRDSGDYESWLKFFLAGVAEVCDEATATARNIVGLRESHRHAIAETFGRAAGSAIRLLEHMYVAPIVSVNEAASHLGVTYVAASHIVRRLTEHGFLREVTGHHRNRRFRYEPYVNLFR